MLEDVITMLARKRPDVFPAGRGGGSSRAGSRALYASGRDDAVCMEAFPRDYPCCAVFKIEWSSCSSHILLSRHCLFVSTCRVSYLANHDLAVCFRFFGAVLRCCSRWNEDLGRSVSYDSWSVVD